MSVNAMGWEGQVNPKVNEVQKAQDCLLPMGITSENVAHRYGVTRQEQDQAAVSHLHTFCLCFFFPLLPFTQNTVEIFVFNRLSLIGGLLQPQLLGNSKMRLFRCLQR
jgi:hypothetical protein